METAEAERQKISPGFLRTTSSLRPTFCALCSGRGFSLIEILVVIGIIAIVSSLGMASFNMARAKARDMKRVADVRQIQAGLELYFDANGTYPAALDMLDNPVPGGSAYLSLVPVPPAGTGETVYRYAVPSEVPVVTYHLGVTLEEEANTALQNDADYDSSAWNNGFDGTAPALYDQKF